MKALPPSCPKRKTGKAAGFRSARQFPWTTEDDVLFAKFTAHEVAERLDRTLSGVWDRRRFLGKTALGYAPHPCRMERVWPQTTNDHTKRRL